MIHKVTVYKDPADRLSDFFTVHFTDPPIWDIPYYSNRPSPIAITKIDGLGLVDADINMSEMVTDGDLFNSARVGKRNIVIDFAFYNEINASIEDTRQRIYGLLRTKSLVYIEIETDNRTLYTKGYVEKNEPDPFSNQSGVQVSILCPDPKLYDADGSQTVTFDGGRGVVDYNDQDVADVSGVLTITIGQDVPPPNNSQTNFLHVWSATQTGISPIPVGAGNDFDIYIPSSGYTAGDIIKVSGIPGNKYCTLTRNGETVDALHLLNKNPEWIEIKRGRNLIIVSGNTEAVSSITFEYSPCYEGV